eukprot:Rhum_TRINITY_DN19605_c0_g1::Rhum_TRINITY_DN19605_c0_g1_i1::g.170305::m.170305
MLAGALVLILCLCAYSVGAACYCAVQYARQGRQQAEHQKKLDEAVHGLPDGFLARPASQKPRTGLEITVSESPAAVVTTPPTSDAGGAGGSISVAARSPSLPADSATPPPLAASSAAASTSSLPEAASPARSPFRGRGGGRGVGAARRMPSSLSPQAAATGGGGGRGYRVLGEGVSSSE